MRSVLIAILIYYFRHRNNGDVLFMQKYVFMGSAIIRTCIAISDYTYIYIDRFLILQVDQILFCVPLLKNKNKTILTIYYELSV